MPRYRTLLFDFDGTLADTEEGVWLAVNAGLTAAGLSPVPRELSRTFIGPPLEDTFHTLGVTDANFQAAWDGYADAYKATGMYQTKAVPGMPEAVRKLKAAGYTLAVASCKPWAYCVPLVELCGFGDSFSVISGSFHNGVPEHKPAIIREAMRQLSADPATTLMIGDRGSDVSGARECGLPCLGVDFCGYAEPGELESAGAVAIVSTPDDLLRFFGLD